MRPVVCDASVAVAWFADEAQSAAARDLQEGEASLLAPTLLLLETANALLTHMRRGLSSPPNYAQAALRVMQGGSIAFTSDVSLLDPAISLARRLVHPVYDCLYLALCRREEAVLATFDRKLRRHATSLAIPLWFPDAP